MLLKFIKNFIFLTIIVLSIGIIWFTIREPDKYNLLSVISGSMEPAIKTGSVVITEKSTDYNNDDIISYFVNEDVIVTHRISGMVTNDQKTYYQVRGDANTQPDRGLVMKENVIGKTIFVIPYIGSLKSYIGTLPGLIIMVFIPASILIFFEIVSIVKNVKKLKAGKILNGNLKSVGRTEK